MSILDSDNENTKKEVINIVGETGDGTLRCVTGELLPVLTMRNMMLFPEIILPVHVGRKKSMKLVKEAFKHNKEILACTQYDRNNDNPDFDDIIQIGCIAEVLKIVDMPDKTTVVILQGKSRARIMEQAMDTPYLIAKVEILKDFEPEGCHEEMKALADEAVKSRIMLARESEDVADEIDITMSEIKKPSMAINFVCSNVQCAAEIKKELIEEPNVLERGLKLMRTIQAQLQVLEMRKRVKDRLKGDIDRQQREYFIREEIKSLQSKLSDDQENGGFTDESDIAEFEKKMREINWGNFETFKHFDRELGKLKHMNPQSPDYQVQYAYLQTLLDIPWKNNTKDNFNLTKAEKVINKNHYGMEKVKERILEYLAVLKLKGDLKSPIICLYGPPGVGKTSLGKSIAETLGRKYARISLGGVSDEAEIRGHRKTYIGAMPGRIISNLIKCKSSNPVFILDEIDKLSKDAHGDPSSALLEVLDPEQNSAFHDNYVDADYDLSNVLFIATANDLGGIPAPLRDRMELIEINGYLTEEKIEIATRHLVPQELEKHGLNKKQFKISREALRTIAENYTRESGVRAMDKQIAKILRKVAREIAEEKVKSVSITEENIQEYLGIKKIDHDRYDIEGYKGVVTGLAWTQFGGEILFIETALSKQKECKLSLTGNLGDVMKESAALALEYIKSHTAELGIKEETLDTLGIHLHVPEGATPKDGPSAGITILTAMVSSITGRRVKEKLAMTGEITLRGKLLPVGGIKEKILGAKRAGIKEILLCKENKKDIDEINKEYIEGLTFHYADTMQEALSIALYPAE